MYNKIIMIRNVLINATVVVAMMIITLIVLDYFNPLMGFLKRGISYGVIITGGVLLTITIVVSVFIGIKRKTTGNKCTCGL